MSKKDQALLFLKKSILNRRWGFEEAINVSEVCSELRMSRTPVVDALKELEKEGFVTIVPQVGAYVRRPAEAEMQERILMRVNLEALMVGVATERITNEHLDRLKAVLRSMEHADSAEYAIKNREFHHLIYDASGLVHIKSVAQKYWDYLIYLEAQELLFRKSHRCRSMLEHEMIYRALEERNKPLAKQLVASHLSRALNLRKKDENEYKFGSE